ARCLFFESASRSSLLVAHDLFRKPVSTFRDHALARACVGRPRQLEIAASAWFARAVLTQSGSRNASRRYQSKSAATKISQSATESDMIPPIAQGAARYGSVPSASPAIAAIVVNIS